MVEGEALRGRGLETGILILGRGSNRIDSAGGGISGNLDDIWLSRLSREGGDRAGTGVGA